MDDVTVAQHLYTVDKWSEEVCTMEEGRKNRERQVEKQAKKEHVFNNLKQIENYVMCVYWKTKVECHLSTL